MSLIVFRNDLNLEVAVLTVRSCHPVGIHDLHAPSLIACAWHDIN